MEKMSTFQEFPPKLLWVTKISTSKNMSACLSQKNASYATHTLNTHMIGACIFRQSLCFQTELQEYKNTTICPMNLNFGKKRVEEPEGASKKEEQKDPL